MNKRIPKRTLLLQSLEERILWDATMQPEAPDANSEQASPMTDATANNEKEKNENSIEEIPTTEQEVLSPNVAGDNSQFDEASNGSSDSLENPQENNIELVVIDDSVENSDALVADILAQNQQNENRRLVIVTIDSNESGIDQITEHLNNNDSVDAIHILGHGDESQIYIGHDAVNSSNINTYESQFSAWESLLSEEADILFYGCDVVENENGEALLQQIAEFTGADVSGSDDTTGSENRGADWDLEYQVGDINTTSLLAASSDASWSGILALSAPIGGIDAPASQMIDADPTFKLSFDSPAGSDPGFGPFGDFVISNEVDVQSMSYLGAPVSFTQIATWDGLQWVDSSMNAVAAHPFDATAASTLSIPTGNAVGDVWYGIELPFGSYTESQPEAIIEVAAKFNSNAEVGNPVDMSWTPGYLQGSTADGSAADAIQGTTTTDSTTPEVIQITKSSDLSEAETPTGPNYPVKYTITVDVAKDETVSNIVLTDYLPSNSVFLGSAATLDQTSVDIVPINGGSSSQAVVDYDSGANTIEVDLGSMTGTAVGNGEIQIEYYVYFQDIVTSGGVPNTNSVPSLNESTVVGQHNGVSVTDSGDSDSAAPNGSVDDGDVQVQAQNLTTQKTPQVVTGFNADGTPILAPFTGNAVLPGALIYWTIDVQVSDYHAFNDLYFTDQLSDGQDFIDGSSNFTLGNGTVVSASNLTPTIQVINDSDFGGNTDDSTAGKIAFNAAHVYTSGETPPASMDVSDGSLTNAPGTSATGEVTTIFDISGQLRANGTDGVLVGDLNNTNDLDGDTSDSPLPGDITVPRTGANATTVTLNFYSSIKEAFDNLPGTGDTALNSGDPIENDGEIQGDVGDVADDGTFTSDPAVTGPLIDDTSFSIEVAGVSIDKTIYAVNQIEVQNPDFFDGSSNPDEDENESDEAVIAGIQPGDEVTYRVRVELASVNAENFVIKDFLPIPIYDVDVDFAPTQFSNTPGAAPVLADMVAGNVQFGEDYNLDDTGLEIKIIPSGSSVSVGDSHPTDNSYPYVSFDAPNNQLLFDFGTFNENDVGGAGTSEQVVIDLLLTALIRDVSIKDGASITNQAQVSETDSSGNEIVSEDIVQIKYLSPDLSLQKGVVALSSDSAGKLTSDSVNFGVNFANTDPGTASATPANNSLNFNGNAITLTSFDSNNGILDSNVEDVDGGDHLRYAITIANEGGGDAHDILVEDTLPDIASGFIIPSNSAVTTTVVNDLNLQVYDGLGNRLTAGTDFTATLTGGKLAVEISKELDGKSKDASGNEIADSDEILSDANPGNGLASDVINVKDGDELFLIVYDLELDNELALDSSGVHPDFTYTNTATITEYFQTGESDPARNSDNNVAERKDAKGELIDDDITETATASTPEIKVEKSIISTDLNTDNNAKLTQVTIGERITYEVKIEIPEGEVSHARLFDRLDRGLELSSIDSVKFLDQNDDVASITTDRNDGTNTYSGQYDATPNASTGEILLAPLTSESGPVDYTFKDNGRSEISLELGSLMNTNDDKDIQEFVVITYTVMVVNDSANVSGTNRNNLAQLAYDVEDTNNPGSFKEVFSETDRAANVAIIEPKLEVVKTVAVNNVDSTGNDNDELNPDTAKGDTGDTVTYTIVLQHTSDSDTDAYDVTFTDMIPAGITNVSLVSAIYSNDGSDLAGTEITLAGNNITTSADFTIIKDKTVTLTVTGEIGTGSNLGDFIDNTADITWTSYPETPDRTDFVPAGQEDVERGPSTDTSLSNGESNTYSDSDPARVEVSGNAIEKYLANSELTNETDATADGQLATINSSDGINRGAEATIGETLTYEVVLTIAEGTTNNAVVRDTLDPGLTLVSIDSFTTRQFNTDTNTILAGAAPNLIIENDATDLGIPANDASNGFITYTHNAGASSDQLELNLGDIANSNDNNNIQEQIVLRYTVLVSDTAGNTSNSTGTGTLLNNSAEMTFTNVAGTESFTTGKDSADTVEVIEPDLEVDKSVSIDGPGDAGDKVTYTIIIRHTANSETDAFDVSLSDTLPMDVDFSDVNFGSNTNITINDSNGVLSGSDFEINAGVLQFAATANTQLDEAGNNTVDFQMGSSPRTLTLTITGELKVSAQPQDIVENDADIRYSSLDQHDDGSTNPSGDGDNEEDRSNFVPGAGEDSQRIYTDTDDADFTVPSPTIAKALTGTDVTTAGNAANQATIGELVTYTITVSVPEGTINGAEVLDTLDAGLSYYDLVSVTGTASGSNVSTDLIGGFSSVTGATASQNITFNLGNLTATGDNAGVGSTATSQGDDQIVIVYRAVVTDIAANVNGVANINNSASLSYKDAANATQTTATVEAAPISLVEPKLEVIKQINGLADETDASGLDAGDAVTYTITIQHTGDSTTTAFDTVLNDALPSQFDFSGIDFSTGTNVVVTDTAASGKLTASDFAINAGALQFDVGGATPTSYDIELNRVITVSITGSLNSALPGQTISNQADINWTSLPEGHANDGNANERGEEGFDGEGTAPNPYDDSDDIAYSTLAPTIAKALTGTDVTTAGNAANQATIGELVTYTVTVTVPEGTVNDVEVLDTLDAGLSYYDLISVTGTASGSNVSTDLIGGFSSVTGATASQNITFNLGNLTATGDNTGVGSTATSQGDDQIVIVYRAVVTDIAANVNGVANINNSASLSYKDAANATQTTATVEAAPISLVEPKLEVIKQINGLADETDASGLDAGDAVTYTITIQHTGDSTTSAFDTVLNDALPSQFDFSGIDFSTGTNVVVTDTAASGKLTASDFAINAGALQFDVGGATPTSYDIELNRVITVSITGVVNTSSLPGQTVTNQADINWTSLPEGHANDGNANERGEEGFDGEGTAPNPYDDSDDIAYTTALPTFSKDVVSSSIHGDTDSDSQIDLTIGEEVTYELVATLTEGTTPLIITDTLPSTSDADGSLTFVKAEVSFIGAGVSNSGNLNLNDTDTSAADITVSGDVIKFDFGTVILDGNNTAASEDNLIKVRVTAVVTNTGINASGDELTNSATMNISSTPLTPGVNETFTDTAEVDILEPKLDIAKDFVDPSTGNPLTVINNGDTVRVKLTVENTGNANAYDVVVDDLFNDQDIVFINPVAVTTPTGFSYSFTDGGSGIGVADATDKVAFSANSTVFIPPVASAPSNKLVFEFDVEVTDAVVGTSVFEGLRINNTATVVGDSIDGDPLLANGNPNTQQRQTSDNASDSIVSQPDFDKSVISTNVTDSSNGVNDVTIGERIVYEIDFELPDSDFDGDGTADAIALTVKDNLPQTLELVNATVVSIGADITAPGLSAGDTLLSASGIVGTDTNADSINDQVVLNFGNVSVTDDDNNVDSDQTIVIRIEAIVKDNPLNVKEDPSNPADDAVNDKVNRAEMVFGDIKNNDTATVEVIEPVLEIEKNFVDPTTGQPIFSANAGDFVQVELKIENTGTAVAYDVFVEDNLNGGVVAMQYVDGSGSVIANGGFTDNSNLAAGTNLIRFDQVSLNPGATTTFRVNVQLAASLSLSAGDAIENTANIEGESLPSGNPDQDTEGRTTKDEDKDFIFGIPSIEKEVADNYSHTGDSDLLATSHVGTSSATGNALLEDLTIGEIVTYEVTIVLSDTENAGEIMLIPTSIKDSLPAGLGLVDARVAAIGGNTTIGESDGGEILTSTSTGALLDGDNVAGIGSVLTTSGVASTGLAIGDSLLGGSSNITGTVGGSVVNFNFGGLGTNTVVVDENGDGNFERENTASFVDLVSTEQSIVIQVDAVVLDNAATTTISNPYVNEAQLTWEQATGSPIVIKDTAEVEVVEPKVDITKSFKDPSTGVDLYTIESGKQVLVELSVTNTGTANAYDVVIDDEIDLTYWENITSKTTPAGFNYSLTDGSNATTMDTVVFTMNSDSGSGITDPNNYIAPGEVIVLEFLMEYNGEGGAGFELNNTANVEGNALSENSIPDPQLPGGGSAGLDVDRETTDTDKDNVYQGPNLDKTFKVGLNPDTNSNQFDPLVPDLAINEVVTYTLTVTLPESPVDSSGTVIPIQVNLIDDLPDGFGLVGVEVTDIGSAITSPNIAVGDGIEILDPITLAPIVDVDADFTTANNFADPDNTQDEVTVNFGTVTVDPTSNDVAQQTITVEVTAIVLNINPENDIGNVKTNEAKLEFFGTPTGNTAAPFDTTTPIEKTDSVDVEIVIVPDDPISAVASPFISPQAIQEPSIFDIYSYDVFDRGNDDFDDLMLQIRNDVQYELEKLPVHYMATGITEHGSNVTMLVYGEDGSLIGSRTVLADAAGNWVITFPNLVLEETPHHVEVYVTPVSYNDSTAGEHNTRVYYTPALDSRHFHSKTLNAAQVFSERAEIIMENQHLGNQSPLGSYDDDWNHPHEFLAVSNNEKI